MNSRSFFIPLYSRCQNIQIRTPHKQKTILFFLPMSSHFCHWIFSSSTTSGNMVLYVSVTHIGIITQCISPVKTNFKTSDHNWLHRSLFCILANEMNVLFWNQITEICILSMMFCFTQVLSSKCKCLVISEIEMLSIFTSLGETKLLCSFHVGVWALCNWEPFKLGWSGGERDN